MSDIEIGQVLSLKIRFNNSGEVSKVKHPYLVVGIDNELGTIEVAQLDSVEGKEYKTMMRSNKTIRLENPHETVIDKDSFVQLDNILKVENFEEISSFRRTTDKLSDQKLTDALDAYKKYHEKYSIDEDKNVYMNKKEILRLNAKRSVDRGDER